MFDSCERSWSSGWWGRRYTLLQFCFFLPFLIIPRFTHTLARLRCVPLAWLCSALCVFRLYAHNQSVIAVISCLNQLDTHTQFFFIVIKTYLQMLTHRNTITDAHKSLCVTHTVAWDTEKLVSGEENTPRVDYDAKHSLLSPGTTLKYSWAWCPSLHPFPWLLGGMRVYGYRVCQQIRSQCHRWLWLGPQVSPLYLRVRETCKMERDSEIVLEYDKAVKCWSLVLKLQS